MGWQTENIVALIAMWTGNILRPVLKEFPSAKKYWDWRKNVRWDLRFNRCSNGRNCRSQPCSDSRSCLNSWKKHVYCQKPLTHSVYESRMLTKLAAKYKVATTDGQPGVIQETECVSFCEWIWNNELGEVREVHALDDRPIWPQGIPRPATGNAGTQNS